MLEALVRGGAGALEVGVPFSDPLADGPTIQRANTLALELGYGDVRRPESIYLTYLAFVPAFIGAYSPAMLRRHAARQELKQKQGKIRHGPPGR